MNASEYGLVLFDQIDPDQLGNEFVLSGLQAFESSLFLLSQHRWPSTTLLLWEACEKLLRAATQTKDQSLEAWELQGRFKDINRNLSAALHDKAHEFRKFRNNIAHAGYSPKDDERCLHLFFEAGVPYFDCLLKFLFDNDKKQLSGDLGKWFWQIYRDTRKVIQKKRLKKCANFDDAIFFLQFASRKIFSGRTVYQHAFESHPKLSQLAESHQDQEWEIEQHLRNSYVKAIETTWGHAFELDSVACPICGRAKALIGIDHRADQFELSVVVCMEETCAVYTEAMGDRELLEVFYTAKMDNREIVHLQSDDSEPAEIVHLAGRGAY